FTDMTSIPRESYGRACRGVAVAVDTAGLIRSMGHLRWGVAVDLRPLLAPHDTSQTLTPPLRKRCPRFQRWRQAPPSSTPVSPKGSVCSKRYLSVTEDQSLRGSRGVMVASKINRGLTSASRSRAVSNRTLGFAQGLQKEPGLGRESSVEVDGA